MYLSRDAVSKYFATGVIGEWSSLGVNLLGNLEHASLLKAEKKFFLHQKSSLEFNKLWTFK